MKSYCKYFISFFFIVICCLLQQCCLAQSTTVRPYKFGFTIDEQQHRSEQRDERGIVMGEFGFITADGIYHVTVYATDEQGRFRILAMKNYPYESPPKTVEVMVQPKIAPTTTTAKPLPKNNFYNEACSGCFLTNGNGKPKGVTSADGKSFKNDIRPLSKALPNAGSSSSSSGKPSTASKPQQSSGKSPGSVLTATKTNTGNPPPIMDIIMQKVLPALLGNKGHKTPSTATTLNNNPKGPQSTKPSTGISASIPNKKYNGGSSSGSSSFNGDGDLYRFKYILDYHGHSETGKRNGNKQGSYFSIGDDDVERTIEYVANEFGYQPRIRWRKLDQNEIKSKENTLKDYEFIWFN